MRLLSTLALLAVTTGYAQPRDAAVLRCKEQATQCGRALMTNDNQKFVTCMPPKLIETLGGPEAVIKLLDDGKKEMRAKGIDIESTKVEAPARLYTRGQQTFALVPMTIHLTVPGGRLIQESFMLGISSDRGVKWTFVDGAKLNDPRAKDILPPLPADLTLPPRREPTFLPSPPNR